MKFVKERFDLLHDRNGDTYARDRHTGEVRRMGARQFRDRVTAGFYEQTELAVRDQAWREALGTLTDHLWRLPGGGTIELGQLESHSCYPKFQGRSFTLLLVDECGQ